MLEDKIRTAQIRSGEDSVIASLRAKGLLPEEEQSEADALSSTVPNAVVEKMAEALTAALSISTAWPCGCVEAMPCQFCKIERQVKEALQSYQSISSNPTGGYPVINKLCLEKTLK